MEVEQMEEISKMIMMMMLKKMYMIQDNTKFLME